MAIDAFTDELIAMRHVPEMLTERVHAGTVHNWWRHGIGGVKLETIKIGRKRFTTKAALAEFFRLRGADIPKTPESEAPERSDDMASRLKAAGLL